MGQGGDKRGKVNVGRYLADGRFHDRINAMKQTILAILLFGTLAFPAFAQPEKDPKVKPPVSTAAADMAKAALAAHGGEKLRGIKTLVLRGSVDVTTSMFPQALAGTFAMIFAGVATWLAIKTRLKRDRKIQP